MDELTPEGQHPPDRPPWVSNVQLQLEIKALRSDVKLWILAAVALNQFLANVEVPNSITGVATLGLIAKAVMAARGAS